MNIRDYDPQAGQAFQGDIAIVPMPKEIEIARHDEIKPTQGRLIIQEGELSGHHHAITLPRAKNFKPDRKIVGDPVLNTDSPRLRKAFGGAGKVAAIGTARMFRDPAAYQAMMTAGILARADLAVGCLVVEGGTVVVSHEEHDGIRLPEGRYYVGRQIESAGAEERIVAD